MERETVKVAVLDDYQHVAERYGDWGSLPRGVSVTFFHDWLPFGAELIERLQPFDVIGVMRERTPFPLALLSELPNLRLLVTTGSHNEAIDMDAARELGVVVSGTRSHGRTASELAIAMLLNLARRVPDEISSVRSGGWQTGVGRGVYGKVLGIVGLGNIGSQVAVVALALGMRTIAYSPFTPKQDAEAIGVELFDDLHAMLGEADFVSIHVKLNDGTRGMIGAKELAAMQPHAYLINTSRGPVVDEGALIDACSRGVIAGAALDVYSQEPLPPDHPFRRHPNVYPTPHIGYVIEEAYEIYYQDMVEAIHAFLEGSPIRVLNA